MATLQQARNFLEQKNITHYDLRSWLEKWQISAMVTI
jgi:hypothetical protein